MTAAVVETVSQHELRVRRERLLRRVGTSWDDLERRAYAYALTDAERSVYDTIRGIDWLLSGRA